MTGLGVIAWLVHADVLLLYLPEEKAELSRAVLECAEKLGMDVRIEYGIVDMRMMRNGVVSHIQTLAAVADVLAGQYEGKTRVSVVKYVTSRDCETVSGPHDVLFGTKVSDVTGSLDGIKAVRLGDMLYRADEISGLVLKENTELGDGVIRLYTEGCCMVDAALKELLASREKSCGKCSFCREGLIQLHTRMKEMVSGKGDLAGTGIMEEIGKAMAFSCFCSIGNSGGAFTLGTLDKFMNEYVDHAKKKRCTAGSCLAFVNVYIDPQKCDGCGRCVEACEGNYIEGLKGYIHMIEDTDCTKCKKCLEACPNGAILSTTDYVPRLPDRLTRVGRFKRY